MQGAHVAWSLAGAANSLEFPIMIKMILSEEVNA
jgi:hypothetical protein